MPPDVVPDFPAAHSMDTEWYAVDDDGHVAVFDSGEGGAVPVGVDEDALDGLARRLSLDHGEWLWSKVAIRGLHVKAATMGPILAFVRADRRRRLSPPEEEGQSFPDGDRLLVPAWWWSREDIERLHARDACAGCLVIDADFWSRLGMFKYACPRDVSPYVRAQPPADLLELGDVPAPLRDVLAQARLPGARFAAAPAIQPLEHLACATWRATGFFGLDGEYRPLDEASTAIATWPPMRGTSSPAPGPWKADTWWRLWR